jgi:hypothetical protein
LHESRQFEIFANKLEFGGSFLPRSIACQHDGTLMCQPCMIRVARLAMCKERLTVPCTGNSIAGPEIDDSSLYEP